MFGAFWLQVCKHECDRGIWGANNFLFLSNMKMLDRSFPKKRKKDKKQAKKKKERTNERTKNERTNERGRKRDRDEEKQMITIIMAIAIPDVKLIGGTEAKIL